MNWFEPVKYVDRGKGKEMACQECGEPLPYPFYRITWRYHLPFCSKECADTCQAPPDKRTKEAK